MKFWQLLASVRDQVKEKNRQFEQWLVDGMVSVVDWVAGLNWLLIFVVAVIASVVVSEVIFYSGNWPTAINDDESISTFATMKGVDEYQITVIKRSNSSPLTGDPFNVRYELRIADSYYNGYCVSARFSKAVCTLVRVD